MYEYVVLTNKEEKKVTVTYIDFQIYIQYLQVWIIDGPVIPQYFEALQASISCMLNLSATFHHILSFASKRWAS